MDAYADLAQARSAETQEEYCRILRQMPKSARSGDAHPAPQPEPSGGHAQSGNAALVPSSPTSIAEPGVRRRFSTPRDAKPFAADDKPATSSGDRPSAKRPSSSTALCEKLPAKRASVAIESSSTGVAQSAAAKQFPSHAGRVLNTESGADLKSEENRKSLLLQLKRPHYDAIKERRKLWEARPLFDGSFRQTIYDKLAVVGNAAILQSGAGTNDRVCIAEVRRYVPQGLSYPLEDMVVELGADLLPDVADTRGRAKIYEALYGSQRCARGFVAMRLEWPNDSSLPKM